MSAPAIYDGGGSVLKRLRWVLLALLSALAAPAFSASVLLDVYVSSSIFESDGTTPLADGSIIHVVGGTSNGTNDGFPSSGTNLVSNLTNPDDTILAVTVINSATLDIAGTFRIQFFYDDTLYDHFYLRAFDTTLNFPYPTGTVFWGASSVLPPNDMGTDQAELAFGGFNTSNENTFVTVPEPGTGQLILLFMGCALVYRAARSPGRVKLAEARAVPAASPPPRDWL